MARPAPGYIPKMRRKSGTRLAVVTLPDADSTRPRKRHDFLLGPYGSEAATVAYHRLIADWEAAGRRTAELRSRRSSSSHSSQVPLRGCSLAEVFAAYLRHIEATVADASRSSTISAVKIALRFARERFGLEDIDTFGPKKLKQVRQAMVDSGRYTRRGVNRKIIEIRKAIRWGVSEEMVHPHTFVRLEAVQHLTPTEWHGRESRNVRPVEWEHVEAVQPYVARQVWAVVNLQWLNGARGSELLTLRPIDFDTSDADLWIARIARHKTAHHGRGRLLRFGRRAQVILRPFMADRPLDAFLFSPAEAYAEMRSETAHNRRGEGQPPTRRKTDRRMGDHYTSASYRRAIERACMKAGIPKWTPHQLRHAAARLHDQSTPARTWWSSGWRRAAVCGSRSLWA